jgi:hypothetical protein
MNPDPISTGNRFTGRQGLRRDARPANGQQPVMARHPSGRKVWMTRIDEQGNATYLAAIFFQIAREFRPRKIGHHQIPARSTVGHGNDRF